MIKIIIVRCIRIFQFLILDDYSNVIFELFINYSLFYYYILLLLCGVRFVNKALEVEISGPNGPLASVP